MSAEDHYPNAPGHQDTDASKAAAESMVGTAATLRKKVYAVIYGSAGKGMTAEEVSSKLGLAGPHKTTPRISELRNKGMITDTGKRRENSSGRSAIVWVAAKIIKKLYQ